MIGLWNRYGIHHSESPESQADKRKNVRKYGEKKHPKCLKIKEMKMRKEPRRMFDKDWMGKCINAGELLYGEFPMSVFHQMYQQKREPVSTEVVMEHHWGRVPLVQCATGDGYHWCRR